MELKPDGILFVGDLGESDLRIVKAINQIPIPTSIVLGNHDRGYDKTGQILKTQIELLGEKHCGWSLSNWNLPLVSVVGARPCSSGGGYFLSEEVKGAFGDISIEDSIDRIVESARQAPESAPLVILAHSGPSGLGSSASSICGRDWKSPAVDWGDKDLEIAIDKIRKWRVPDLVVFGHMHHHLRRGMGCRETFCKDNWGTSYLNAACVPRSGEDPLGQKLFHFSWVEFKNGVLSHVSHRWYRKDASLAYEENLLLPDF